MKFPPLDVYILYAYVGILCAFIIGIIRNRTRATEYKKTVDKYFINLLVFFIVFCAFDAAWGIIGSFFSSKVPILYTLSSYAFHLLSAISSFVCSMYGAHFLKLKGEIQKVALFYRIFIIVLQFGLIFQNPFTHNFFLIVTEPVDATQHVGQYVSGDMRTVSFILQFLQYVPLLITAIVLSFKNKSKKKILNLYLSGAFFLLIPPLFGVLQLLYPDGPFYSFGFAIVTIAIYAINVTKDREEYLADYHRIEEQKKSQNAIEEALNAAKVANNVRSSFLANMSHDIRTPINGIMGLTELAKKEEMSDKMKEYVDKIDVTSRHLLSLVNDVLDMTAIENKQADLISNNPINILNVFNDCYSIIGGQLFDSDIAFNRHYLTATNHPVVLGDELHLRQILINILGNAVKFTHEGSINFDIAESSVSSNIVSYTFIISDTGIGMSEDFVKHIFEPFSQENSGGRSKYVGTGLGMSITKQLVELMKGTISIESTVGKGSKFVVTIPFEISNENLLDELKNHSQKCDLTGLKCLLVEDNELNMEIASTLLESYNLVVTQCSNGNEALDIFINNKPGTFDLIFMDVMMPIMNGYEATKAIRESGKEDAKEICIIAMTANVFDEDKKKASLAGMDGHIAKPINFETIISEISKIMKSKKANNE